MNLYEILDQIPNYKEFMTVIELDESSKQLAREFPQVKLFEIGKSREERSIYCLKIGNGVENALLFAFPHPNEPIGSMTLEFLSRFLAEHPDFTEEIGYSWYMIKAIDIDGAALNEGWFKGNFNPLKYAKNFYRPARFEQIEWSFPVTYKKLAFNNIPPETQALMKIINELKPRFMYGLHNAAFGGVFFYISRGVGNLFADLTNFVRKEQLPLHLGEPEAPYIEKLHDAIFRMMGTKDVYDYLEARGVENPQEFIKTGTTPSDYLKNITNKEHFHLVSEIPYFYDDSIDDTSLTGFERRELMLESLDYKKSIYKHSRKIFQM